MCQRDAVDAFLIRRMCGKHMGVLECHYRPDLNAVFLVVNITVSSFDNTGNILLLLLCNVN